MRRVVANLLLSLLLLATLTRGGCISCEQYFMWPGAKGCCTPNGRCKRKTPRHSQTVQSCEQIAFDHHKSMDFHVDLAVAHVAACDAPVQTGELSIARSHPRWVAPSPPDLQILHSTFLI